MQQCFCNTVNEKVIYMKGFKNENNVEIEEIE